MDFSLKDIFEEKLQIDEALRELAESLEEVSPEDLAKELQQFLSELGG